MRERSSGPVQLQVLFSLSVFESSARSSVSTITDTASAMNRSITLSDSSVPLCFAATASSFRYSSKNLEAGFGALHVQVKGATRLVVEGGGLLIEEDLYLSPLPEESADLHHGLRARNIGRLCPRAALLRGAGWHRCDVARGRRQSTGARRDRRRPAWRAGRRRGPRGRGGS